MTMLSGLDVNLIVPLHALLQQRSVTRAAKEVGLGQSSMSHALARLRLHFADPLLVPAGRGLALTERAQALTPQVEAAVAQLERVFAPAEPFAPKTTTRQFNLAATDNLELYLMPKLAQVLAREAPSLTVRVHHLPSTWQEELSNGTFDLKLGRKYPIPARFYSEDLAVEEFTCVVRRSHPDIRQRLTIEHYARLSHIVVSPSGAGQSPVDELLAQLGLQRHIAMTVPHFLVAPFIVAQSDFVLTAPARLIAPLAKTLQLRTFRPPLALPSYTLSQTWAERTLADPGHRWLRRLISRLVR